MNPSQGYYSLIQFCPDLERLEAANVGVLLFCPERHFLKARTVRGNQRVSRFFGSEGHDWDRLNAFKKGLVDRLEMEANTIHTLEDLHQFIASRANLLQITPPRPMKVLDPANDLDKLLRDMLGEPSRRTSTRGLRKYLGERFTIAGLDQKIRRDVTVQLPVRGKPIEIPFGYQNCRFNLITPATFESADADQSFRTACKYAVEGRSLYDHPDPNLGELQLVVVGKFRANAVEVIEQVRRVFGESGVQLFRIEELSELLEEIRRTGSDIGEPAVRHPEPSD